MLMLLVHVGDDRYVFECSNVIEVIPKVNLKPINYTPPYVAGLLNFRGVPIPVIDLCCLIEGRPSNNRLHTRIVLLKIPLPDGEEYLVGLLAERVLQTVNLKKNAFVKSGVHLKE